MLLELNIKWQLWIWRKHLKLLYFCVCGLHNDCRLLPQSMCPDCCQIHWSILRYLKYSMVGEMFPCSFHKIHNLSWVLYLKDNSNRLNSNNWCYFNKQNIHDTSSIFNFNFQFQFSIFLLNCLHLAVSFNILTSLLENITIVYPHLSSLNILKKKKREEIKNWLIWKILI